MLGPASGSTAQPAVEAGLSDGDRPLRRDAERNRERILTAARELFAERGLEVAVDEIARRAGVGMGTLYRRFPNKDALIDAILRTVVEQSRTLAHEALAAQPRGEALYWYVFHSVGSGAYKNAFLSNRLWTGRMHDLFYDQVIPVVEQLFANAQAAGTIRADAQLTDLLVVLRGMRGVVDATEGAAPGTWRRHLDLMFDGLRPSADHRPLTPAPIDLDVLRRMPPRVPAG